MYPAFESSCLDVQWRFSVMGMHIMIRCVCNWQFELHVKTKQKYFCVKLFRKDSCVTFNMKENKNSDKKYFDLYSRVWRLSILFAFTRLSRYVHLSCNKTECKAVRKRGSPKCELQIKKRESSRHRNICEDYKRQWKTWHQSLKLSWYTGRCLLKAKQIFVRKLVWVLI